MCKRFDPGICTIHRDLSILSAGPLHQPILKHYLPVEDLGTTPPPKEDPVFDLKPLPDNLKYAHIDDKKLYPIIISSKISGKEEERL